MAGSRGEHDPGKRNVSRVVVVCESAQTETLSAEHLAMLNGDRGVIFELAAQLLRRRSALRRLTRQLCGHRHLGRRVLLIRRLDKLNPTALCRLRRWLDSRRSPADWQVLTVRAGTGADVEGTDIRRIDHMLQPDLLIHLGADAPRCFSRRVKDFAYG